MRALRAALPTGAVVLAAILLWPTKAVGWSVLGGDLLVTERDFRIFNNFSDPAANNNTTPDPNFPGYDGAELAIWKACIEWDSEKHGGTGEGDPHQPGGLGSGKANFDAVFQGNATGVGGIASNVFSEETGSMPGVLAYTEWYFVTGWRIRFYSDPWAWKDGPNEIVGGQNAQDIQGVACHEYGHALGLDHSTNFGATMFPSSTSASSNEARSINGDDKGGLQFIYGAVDFNVKPSIDAVSGGVPLTITGINFDATSNEVWFTQASAGGNGTPVKATGVASIGGTQIVIASPPANAGPGDIHVKIPGGAHTSLSNSWPWDPNTLPCGTASNYCTPGTSASGCQAVMSASGTPSASAPSGFTVTATSVEGDKDGLFFYGTNGQQANAWGTGTSLQCVVPPVVRAGLLAGVGTAGACDGTFSQDLNALWTSNPLKNPGGGVEVNCQLWYRDPFNTSNQTTSLSDALSFTTCP